MGKKSVKKTAKVVRWDPQKDSIFKQLAGLVESAGYIVRREELKQGHGWRVVSGACRLEDRKMIFVDKRLPQDEQITFLIQRMSALNIEMTDAQLAALPEKTREMVKTSRAALAA